VWFPIRLGGDDDRGDQGKASDHAFGKAAMEFIQEKPTTKIIVVVDAHCIENGTFVYKGDSPPSYMGCSLYEVGTPNHSYHAFLTSRDRFCMISFHRRSSDIFPTTPTLPTTITRLSS
jgi:hypothetical protein